MARGGWWAVWAVVVVLSLLLASPVLADDDEDEIPMNFARVRVTATMACSLYATSEECYECVPQLLAQFSPAANASEVWLQLDSEYPIHFKANDGNQTHMFFSHHFGEQGTYALNISTAENGQWTYALDRLEKPYPSWAPVVVMLAIITALFALYGAWKAFWYFHRRNYTRLEDREETEGKPRKNRIISIDAFRGLSLTVMLFVNYGGGDYFYFAHAVWNGLTVADLVFPWFIFLMGTSLPISLKSRASMSKLSLFLKTLQRSVELFVIGLFLNNGYDVAHWRIPGVLQRFGVTFFVVAMIVIYVPKLRFTQIPTDSFERSWSQELVCDILPYMLEYIIVLLITTVFLVVTFALDVPHCGRGYLGPGGIGNNGEYADCTGGAAGYLDKLLLTENHVCNLTR
eukprot:TRINITY_DN1899_c0_g1_i2.p1 TRINITY_DN1899_c0_g1~~TRINITY_DN1899_c0_g1_i2.p1  ORF type:complete len:401 (+),score=130.90 TRINITY_DN1899_c0_g1_i2:31-1233(+)